MSKYPYASKTCKRTPDCALIFLSICFPWDLSGTPRVPPFSDPPKWKIKQRTYAETWVAVGNMKAQWTKTEKGSLAASPSKEKHLKNYSWWHLCKPTYQLPKKDIFPPSCPHGTDCLNGPTVPAGKSKQVIQLVFLRNPDWSRHVTDLTKAD